MGNNAAGVNAVEELFIRTLEAGIDEAAWKARRIPPRKEKSWPELTWTDFKSKVPLILDSLTSLKQRIQNSETVSIEFDVTGARLEQMVHTS